MNIISALNIKGKGSIFNLSVFRQKLLAKTLHSRRKWQDGQTSVYHTQKDSWTLHAQIPPKECLTFETFWPARNLINFVWISQFWKWTWVIWKYRKFKRKLIGEFLFFLLFFIPFFSIVNSLMVSNIVPDALVSITGKGSERFLGQLPQEKKYSVETIFLHNSGIFCHIPRAPNAAFLA